MMLRRLLAMLLLATIPIAAPALGQPHGDAADAREAIALGREAKEKYDRGDWAGALELFEAAEQKAHSPVLLLYIARCQRNLGRLLRARDVYRRIAEEPLPAGASAPFLAARSDAASDLQALTPRIPRLSVDTSRLPAGAVIELDGEVVEASRLGQPLAVDPGAHELRARLGSREVARAAVRADEGGSHQVRLVPRAATTPPPKPSPKVVPGGDTKPEAEGGSYVPGAVVLGFGVAALAAGVALRVVALQKIDDVESRCVGTSCLAEDEEEVDTAIAMQTASTVCFVVGGAAAATGVVLLLVRPGGGDPAVALRVLPNGVGVAGTF
jgi:hypothetical protein